MDIIYENLETEISDKCDCFIAGGGFAGISAALAAARRGANVILAEREYILGGLGTAGIVTIYLPLCDGMGNQISFGIAEELFRLSVKYGAEKDYPAAWLESEDKEARKKQRFQVQYNPHIFAILAEKLLLENGVKILYGTTVCNVNMENSRITHAIVENKSGRYAVGIKKCIVDCTGDADIAKLSGAKTKLFERGNSLAAWYYSVSVSRGLTLHPIGMCDSSDDITSDNSISSVESRRFTGINGEELSEMVQTSHSFVLNDILNKKKRDASHVPVTIPTIPQIRMSRRISGLYTMDDTEMHKSFSDSVGLFSDWRNTGPVYELPFGTLYGKEVDNLLCAGRCISVTDNMWDITRVIPVCAVSGEAAGTAAAMTDKLSEIDIKGLQQTLINNGVKLHEQA